MNKAQPNAATIDSVLRITASETGVPLSELRLLMQQVTGLSKVQLILKDQEPMPAPLLTAFKALATRRQQGEPIAYILGHKEFYSRDFKVDQHVLIPRPETEELVEHALGFLQEIVHLNLQTSVLDIGTGSGAIAITLALENPLLQVWGLDICEDALSVAQQNAAALKAESVTWLSSDLFDALGRQTPQPTFDLIVSNPPYIEAGDPHLDQGDLRYEPPHALTDHGDGYSFYRSIAEQGKFWLKPHGAVLVEHGYTQQANVISVFRHAGFQEVRGLPDLAGTPRFVFASPRASA